MIMENKVWFIKVNGRKEGPFSIQDLKSHPRMTPDTLVWKEGFKDWIPARRVPELNAVFEDKEQPVDLHERFKVKTITTEDSILALEGSNFPFLFFWIFVLLVIFSYLFYKLNGF